MPSIMIKGIVTGKSEKIGKEGIYGCAKTTFVSGIQKKRQQKTCDYF